MKIVRLTAENVKKLRAVEITPSGELVQIAGRNGQGKTSVLDSIWWALAGTKHIQGEPIRKGESKARIHLDLGEIVVERKFSATGSTLSVDSADGARFPSPQKMLDALLGELSFDPLAFARMEPRKQFDELRRVSKLEVDIDHLEALNRTDYDRRTEVNRDAKARRAQAEGIKVPAEIAEQAQDEAALVDELQRAGEVNADIEARKGRRAAAEAEIAGATHAAQVATERVRQLRAEADQIERGAEEALAKAAALQKRLDEAPALPESVDVAALRARIDAARQLNAAIVARRDAVDRRAELADAATKLEEQARVLTERIEARVREKEAAIQKAAMPVEGLGLGAGVVTYNGIPFDQASSAEQLRVSMAIAMAANPRLRVIRIVDGSLLDEDSLAAIGEMAKAGDFQVWIEQVRSDGKVGIVIDDGAVVSTPESREAEAAHG